MYSGINSRRKSIPSAPPCPSDEVARGLVNMSRATNLLEDVAASLQNLDRPVVRDLKRPGLPAEDVAARIGNAPQAVQDWYTWCNGTAHRTGQTVGDSYFIPGYFYPSLDEALRIRGEGHHDLDALGDWLPVLTSPSADMYAVVWNSDRTLGVVGVLEGAESEIEYLSVEEMLEVFSAALREGAFFVQGGAFEVDDDRMDEIYRQVTGRRPLY